MGTLDADASVACLSSLERSPSANHGAAHRWPAMESSAIDHGADHDADRLATLRRAFKGELNASVLGTGESNACGVLDGCQPDEPDAARLTATHELDRDLDLRESDLKRVALGGSRNTRPEAVHASNVGPTPKRPARRGAVGGSTAAQ